MLLPLPGSPMTAILISIFIPSLIFCRTITSAIFPLKPFVKSRIITSALRRYAISNNVSLAKIQKYFLFYFYLMRIACHFYLDPKKFHRFHKLLHHFLPEADISFESIGFRFFLLKGSKILKCIHNFFRFFLLEGKENVLNLTPLEVWYILSLKIQKVLAFVLVCLNKEILHLSIFIIYRPKIKVFTMGLFVSVFPFSSKSFLCKI